MADEIHHPHDSMVRAVLSDPAEATTFLQTHLAEEVSQSLNWSTLKLLQGSFVDEDLRRSETDFLYEVERVSEIREAHRFILDSVTYATRIQQGLLPTQEQLATACAESSVLWQPRDLVGGFNRQPETTSPLILCR